MTTIDNAKTRAMAYALTNGGGLQLEVLPSGSKTWRFKCNPNAEREKVTSGAHSAFTLKQARDGHEAMKNCARGSSATSAQPLMFRTFAQRWVDRMRSHPSGGYVVRTMR